MRSELESIRCELQIIRELLTELKQRESAPVRSAEALQDAGPDLAQVDKKLDTILAQLGALRRTVAAEQAKNRADTTVYKIDIGTSAIRGARDAPVTIIEFADFQCPFCIREWPKLKQILDEYPDKVRFVFKHFPLSRHTKAKPAHAATILAKELLGDDGFWRMHDLIVGNPKKLEPADLRKHAEALGLDLARFDELMANPTKIDQLLAADLAEARKCAVRGTPTILINGLKLADRSIDGYKTRIAEILGKKAQPAKDK